MALYKRRCLNPKCDVIFITKKHNQKYHSVSCRIEHTSEKARSKRVEKLVMKKCNWCGNFNFRKRNEEGYCDEQCKINWLQLEEQRKICYFCHHWCESDQMCEYTIHTGRIRDIWHHPCRQFEKKVKK